GSDRSHSRVQETNPARHDRADVHVVRLRRPAREQERHQDRAGCRERRRAEGWDGPAQRYCQDREREEKLEREEDREERRWIAEACRHREEVGAPGLLMEREQRDLLLEERARIHDEKRQDERGG